MVVYVTHNIHEAQIVAGRLEHEGIPALLHTEPGASAMGITIGRLGEIKVLVHPENYDIALNILFPEEAESLPEDVDRVVFDADDDITDDAE